MEKLEKENTLITTAISYVNGEPHIGHLYEMILADFFTKWHKLINTNVKLCHSGKNSTNRTIIEY